MCHPHFRILGAVNLRNARHALEIICEPQNMNTIPIYFSLAAENIDFVASGQTYAENLPQFLSVQKLMQSIFRI